MSQACPAFPFSQKNSLNTLEAMESHLEAEVEGWVMTASFSDAGLWKQDNKQTLRCQSKIFVRINALFIYL